MPKNRDEFRSEMPATAERIEAAGKVQRNANAELVESLRAAFVRGDLDFIVGKLDDQVSWAFPGKNVIASEGKGKDAVRGWLAKVGEESRGTVKPELIAAWGDDEYGVLFLHTTGERQGKRLDIKEVLVFTIRNGLVTEVVHRPDQAAVDAFFA